MTAPVAGGSAAVGIVLRHWHGIRRLSQMNTAHAWEVSTRHLSFIENGHSRASREVLKRLAETLDMPLRERNHLLLTAGFAPEYHERELMSPELQRTLRLIGEAVLPLPVYMFDRTWNLVSHNSAAEIFLEDLPEHLFEPQPSVLRAIFHPDGLGDRVEDIKDLRVSMLSRLSRQARADADLDLADLYREMNELYRAAHGDDRATGAGVNHSTPLTPLPRPSGSATADMF